MVVCLQGFLSESIDSQQKGFDFERPILEIEAKAVIYIVTNIFRSKIAEKRMVSDKGNLTWSHKQPELSLQRSLVALQELVTTGQEQRTTI